MTKAELEQEAALMHAIIALGQLLPNGMEMHFYRVQNDPRTMVESRYDTGEVTHVRLQSSVMR